MTLVKKKTGDSKGKVESVFFKLSKFCFSVEVIVQREECNHDIMFSVVMFDGIEMMLHGMEPWIHGSYYILLCNSADWPLEISFAALCFTFLTRAKVTKSYDCFWRSRHEINSVELVTEAVDT